MNSRKKVRCKACNSLERTRLLWMYIERLPLKKGMTVLHLAPEQGLAKAVRERIGGANYVAADLEPKRYPGLDCVPIDLCKLEDEPSLKFDLILHCHVLEHIPCNIAYTLFHLHRMLKDDGKHICVIPFLPGRYDESFEELSDSERQKRFGQYDHVRKFGSEDIDQHLGAILNLPKSFDAASDFPPTRLREAHIPEGHWSGFHPSTVLCLNKSDYKLQ